MKFVLVPAIALAVSVVGVAVVQTLEWPYWSYHAMVILFGIVLYDLRRALAARFIRKRTLELASSEKSVEDWSPKTGTPSEPVWISMVSIVGIACLLASPFEMIAWFFRTAGHP